MGLNARKQKGGWRERGRVWVGMRGNKFERDRGSETESESERLRIGVGKSPSTARGRNLRDKLYCVGKKYLGR